MYRVFKILAISVPVTLLIFIFAKSAFAEKIIIRVDEKSFPATYKKENKWEGMDVDIIREILSRANLEYDFVEIPFQRSLYQIKDGQIHLIPDLVKNEARSKYLYWLGPTRITCIGLVVQEKDQHLPIKTTDDLITIALQKQKKLGYLTGASYSPFFDDRLKHDTLLNEVLNFLPDNSQHRQMLQLGRLFGYFYDAFEIQQRMSDPIFAYQYKGLALHSYRIEESCTGAYIGISKNLDKKVYQKIMHAFQTMHEDGTFADMYLRWMGSKPTF